MLTAVARTRELFERDELPEELRWIDDLAPRHQRLFYAELQLEWSKYCLTGDEGALSDFFDDWHATAEADASSEHSAFLLEGHDESDYDEWPKKAAG